MQLIKHFGAGSAALLFSVLFASGLNAQDTRQPEQDTLRIYQLDEIVISASRWEEPAASTGRNVSVITWAEIENAAVFNLSELLAGRQNLQVVGNRQTPGSLQQFFLRNANTNHSIVMIDGVRISDPSTVNNGIDLSELSLSGVERIEIVRGSHSTVYGSSAIGGVINIITRGESQQGFSGDLSTQHGTFGGSTYSTGNTVSANYVLENGLYFDGGGFLEHARGMDATIDTVSNPGVFNPTDGDDFRKLDLNGKIGYRTSDFDAYASYRRADQRSDVDAGAYNDDDNASVAFNRNLISYGADYGGFENWEISFSGAYSNLTRDFVNDSSRVDEAGNYDGTYTETNGEGSLFQNEITARYRADGWSLLAGAGSSRQAMSSKTYTFSRPFNFESTTDLDSLDLSETINSLFILTELEGALLSGELDRFTLGLDGRYGNHDEFGSYFTYEINPQYRLGSSSLLYAALSTGFNAPSLYQLYTPERGFGAYTSRGNETLKPETSTSMELGWKQTVSNSLRVELSLFRTRVKDVIEYVYLWDGGTAVEDLGFADYLGDTYINISRQEVDGVELSVNFIPGRRLRFDWNISLTKSTLTFTPGDIDESYTGGHHVQIFESGAFADSKRELEGLTRRPSVMGSAALNYYPASNLSLTLTSRFTGRRDDIYFSEDLGPFGALDREKMEGYNVTDVSVQYRFGSRLRALVRVENVFDTDYVEINGFNTRGRGVLAKLTWSF